MWKIGAGAGSKVIALSAKESQGVAVGTTLTGVLLTDDELGYHNRKEVVMEVLKRIDYIKDLKLLEESEDERNNEKDAVLALVASKEEGG